MTPEALLALVEEATRAPFGWFNYVSGPSEVVAQQKLARLAPSLARLCVEQQEALEAIEVSEPDWAQGVDENCETLRTIARAALARFAALENQEQTSGGDV